VENEENIFEVNNEIAIKIFNRMEHSNAKA
jgi:hypothetical protein